MFKRQSQKVLGHILASSSCSLDLCKELIINLLLDTDLFESLRLGVYITLESPCFLLPHPLQFPYTSIILLLESPLSGSTFHSVLYAIN